MVEMFDDCSREQLFANGSGYLDTAQMLPDLSGQVRTSLQLSTSVNLFESDQLQSPITLPLGITTRS